jgi:pimeloyl-ACP methyl ester carboxylesterase
MPKPSRERRALLHPLGFTEAEKSPNARISGRSGMSHGTHFEYLPGVASTSQFEDVRTTTVNGAVLAYRETGNGEPVVFLHGDISDLRTWEQQLVPVGAAHRAIAYSRRFFRPNQEGGPDADYSWPRHVDDLLAFLGAVDATPAHLVGNSSGAYIALLAALRQPDAVRSLVLEEPPVIPLLMSIPPRPGELLGLLARRPRTAYRLMDFGMRGMLAAERAFRRGDDDKGLRTFARGVLGGRRYFDRISTERFQQMAENVRPLRAQLMSGALPPLVDSELRAMRVPTLIVTGQHTAPFMHPLMDRLEELLPNVERVAIPGSSHFMHEDNAPALNAAILRFLGSES